MWVELYWRFKIAWQCMASAEEKGDWHRAADARASSCNRTQHPVLAEWMYGRAECSRSNRYPLLALDGSFGVCAEHTDGKLRYLSTH